MSFLEHRRPLQSMRKFYNWFYKYYGGIERTLGEPLEEVVSLKIKNIPGASGKTVLEYACGSGLLSLRLAGIFKSVDGRDLSSGMIGRAKMRAEEAGLKINFKEGNILEPDEAAQSYDYVFISFALHLFDTETEKIILKNMLEISREALIIIDHGKNWKILPAFIEWIEGSYYDRFIKTDFIGIAKEIGAAGFEEAQIADCTYMIFIKK